MNLQGAYRSSSHLLSRDFLGQVLGVAATYDRAAAFFSSSVLATASPEFAGFFERGGRVRLVCSPAFSSDDALALSDALYNRPRLLKDSRSVERLLSAGDPAVVLSHLVVRGQLHVRVAVPDGAGYVPGIYHEKIGIIADGEGDFLAFTGSANESKSAWQTNFERLDVHASWGEQAERRRAQQLRLNFSDLWRNNTPGLQVVELHEAFSRGLVQELESEPDGRAPRRGARVSAPPETLVPPPGLELYSHQESAIRAWAGNHGRGILEMATGSGKTITALALATKVSDKVGPGLAVLVIAPFIHLVDQWREVMALFGLRPIRCAESRRSWYDQLAASVAALNAGDRPVLSIATTSATLARPHLQELLRRIRRPLLVIGDEAHNYGAVRAIEALPGNAVMRLGLSATPDRWMDDEGTERLHAYFGKVVFRYDLADAIRDEVLTPYRYHPVLVDLEPDELDEYLELTRSLAKYIHGDKDGALADAALFLLLKRARLIASARQKLPKLRGLLETRRRDTHMLVYCGDGQVEGPDDATTLRQVDAVVKMIGVDLKMTCASYTADTPPARRRELLEHFERGELQVLVAIRCLDEGVDVPATRAAFILASSTNPRQFIQRRGRVLRKHAGKRRAEVFDFFVSPGIDALPHESEEYRVVRRLFGNQLRRAGEFAGLAENGPEARRQLLELTEHLNLFTAWEAQDA